MDEGKRRLLERQGYKIVGEHSGVKTCHWTRKKLLHGRDCYKGTFYGIESHRCVQMTPSVDQCNLNCLFCWRAQDWGAFDQGFDDPAFIFEECIKVQRTLMSGYRGDSRVSTERWEEAQEPKHVAISLTGEPTLYRHLGEYIRLCHENGMTTFLVTNGTTPGVLEGLDPLPTQLYVTVAAPNEEIYRKLLLPKSTNGWQLTKRTLELLPSLDTRTVVRHTLTKGWNLGWEDQYAALDAIAEPAFIECKAYMFIGGSRLRMTIENMPSHEEIREFAGRLSDGTGYPLEAERDDSRAVLLMKSGVERFLPT
jgi:tRNA wybutosine-synthesizing protein 1